MSVPRGRKITASSYNSPDTSTFLISRQSRFRDFFGNLAEVIGFNSSRGANLQPAIVPDEFWPDVFVQSGVAWRSLFHSLVYHGMVMATIGWVSHVPWQLPRPGRSFSDHTHLVFYHVSEYLPPLQGFSPRANVRQKGDLRHARQEFISVPPESDNRTQTIISPQGVKLRTQIALPNLVTWAPVAPTVPVPASLGRRASQIIKGELLSSAIAPVPEVRSETLTSRPKITSSGIVTPSPAPLSIPSRNFQQTIEAFIKPPPAPMVRELDNVNVPMNIEPKIAAPKLSINEKQALNSGAVAQEPGPQKLQAVSRADHPVQTPDVGGLKSPAPLGQLVVLGLDPIIPGVAIDIPSGNRRGTFSAGPSGRAGTRGTPELIGGGTSEGSGRNGEPMAPEGIRVSPGPLTISSDRAAVSGPASLVSQRLIAAAMMPTIRNLPRQHPHNNITDASDVEYAVFGPKRFYSMTLNMPNLNSKGGSWIIRFAELKVDQQGELTAPIATEKVDPAYPEELMRTHVEGTVTLYAVIHSDGTIGDVRVLRGIDERLDAFARNALTHCRFRPATKNGNAIALEAVFRIPFQASRHAF